MRTVTPWVTVLLLLASLLPCACGRKGQEQGVTLTLYHWMEKDRGLWEEEIIKPFEAAHPGIHVVLQTAPYALYVSKSFTSIASGSQFADVMYAEDWFGQELIRKEYVRNLMPYVRRDISVEEFSAETFTEWRGAGQREDELYGFPACIGLTVLFYNKDMFDRAGVPYPDTSWTYDDLTRVGERLTVRRDGSPVQWGLCFDIQYTGLETVIYSLGGKLLSEGARSAALTDPATVRSLHYIQDLFVKHAIASSTTSLVNSFEQFVTRRAAMILVGSLGAINLEGTSLRWDITYPPKGPEGTRLSRRFTMAYLIPRNSPHPEEAWELIRWIMTKTPAGLVDRQYQGMMPTYKPVAASPAWLDAQPLYNRRLLVPLESGYSFPLFTPGWQEWRDNNLTPEMLAMIRGEKSVEECAASAQERINAVLTRVYAP
jgi:multiple sugar transport system substrate-binding protein